VAASLRVAHDARPLYGAKRGRDVYYGARDQQPALVTTPNASVPGFATVAEEDDD
jgi:hypothetical protein